MAKGTPKQSKVVEDDDQVFQEFQQKDASEGRKAVVVQSRITKDDYSQANTYAIAAVALATFFHLQIHYLYSTQELAVLGICAFVTLFFLSSAVNSVAARKFNRLFAARPNRNNSSPATWYSVTLNVGLFLFGLWFFHAYAIPNLLQLIQAREWANSPYIDVVPSLLVPAILLAFNGSSKVYLF